MKILCWFGWHRYELTVVIHRSHGELRGDLMGHACLRCGKIPVEQAGL